MNAQQFYQYIEHPDKIGIHEEVQIRGVLKEYPYFQSAHLLLAKCLKNMDNYTFEKQLRTAAVFASNRAVMYQLLKAGKDTDGTGMSIGAATAVSDDSFNQNKTDKSPEELIPQQVDENRVSNQPILKSIIEESASTISDTVLEGVHPEMEHESTVLSDEGVYNNEADSAPKLELKIVEKGSDSNHPIEKFSELSESNVSTNESKEILELQAKKDEITKEGFIVENLPTSVAESIYIEDIIPSNEEVQEIKNQPENIYIDAKDGTEELDLGQINLHEELTASATMDIQEPIEKAEETVVSTKEDHDALEDRREEIAKQYQEFLRRKEANQGQPIQITSVESITKSKPQPEPEIEINKIDAPQPEPVKQEERVEPDQSKKLHQSTDFSFTDWLNLGSYSQPLPSDAVVQSEVLEEDETDEMEVHTEPMKFAIPTVDVESILDRFITSNPTISRPKTEFFNPVKAAQKSLESSDDLITETLAKLYEKQGNYQKAIYIYEKLSLKFPEKETIFAPLITELKNKLS